jgi:HEAT repeat protein
MRRLAFIMLTLAALSPLATASFPAWEDTECPVCGFEFEAAAGMVSYTSAGVEADLCPHVLGAHPLGYRIWTCPRCRYSRQGESFREKVSEGLKERTRMELPAGEETEIRPGVRQDEIPAWRKYALAIRIASWRAASTGEMAALYLEASWITRVQCWLDHARLRDIDEGLDDRIDDISYRGEDLVWDATRLSELHGSSDSRTLEGIAAIWEAHLAAGLVPADEHLLVRYEIAYARRRIGENLRAREDFRALLRDDALPPALKVVIDAHIRSIARERGFQSGAVAWMRRALDDGVYVGIDRAIHTYLIAELTRRIGNATDAEAALIRVLQEEDETPSWLVSMAEGWFERVGSRYRLSPSRRQVLRDLQLGRALAALDDDEDARDAVHEIERLRDPRAARALLPLFEEGDEPYFTEYLPMTLSKLPDADGTIARALRRAAVGHRISEARMRAIHALAAMGDVRSRPFFELALSDDDASVRRAAADALGDMGDPAVLGVLRDEWRKCPTRGVMVALVSLGARDLVNNALTFRDVVSVSRMTCTDFWDSGRLYEKADVAKARARFDAWRRENGASDPTKWRLDGLRRAGYEVVDLKDAAAIPVLIEALEDASDSIRFNAAAALRDLTGEYIAWPTLSGRPGARDRREAADLWRAWWTANREKLER